MATMIKNRNIVPDLQKFGNNRDSGSSREFVNRECVCCSCCSWNCLINSDVLAVMGFWDTKGAALLILRGSFCSALLHKDACQPTQAPGCKQAHDAAHPNCTKISQTPTTLPGKTMWTLHNAASASRQTRPLI